MPLGELVNAEPDSQRSVGAYFEVIPLSEPMGVGVLSHEEPILLS